MNTWSPAHPLRLTVFGPRLGAYAVAIGIAAAEGLWALPTGPGCVLWFAAAPWLTRIPLPPAAATALRTVENLATPGLALVAGLPLATVAALGVVLLLGQLNVHGLCAGLGAALATATVLLVAVAADRLPPVLGSAAGGFASAGLLLGFAAAAALLSHRQAQRLASAQETLARRAEAEAALAQRLGRYLPPAVHRVEFEGLASGQPVPRSRRRWLTVCFADLAGFTALTDSVESEDVVRLLDAFYAAMTEAALAHGGTLDKFMGDAVMVFFGDPESRGRRDDARDCLAMAQDMHRRFADLKAGWDDARVVRELGLRVGVHSGWCTVGSFGHAQRREYTVIGATVNAASRLEAAARPGTILLSRTTHALLGARALNCRPSGPVVARGFRDPIEVFELAGVPTAAGAVLDLRAPGLRLRLDPERADPALVAGALAKAEGVLAAASVPVAAAAPERNRLTVSEAGG
ncbi:MAG: adenylate/guanylate cyclase domain-containing protein [Pseudomonadales bacterium]|jgi:class 3 adenylate cyclase|nr:adenylate/guanylate cyclase domain-containing protein [Pseudomonadales bacterium]